MTTEPHTVQVRRTAPTASIRFPGGPNRNPFRSSGGANFGAFFGSVWGRFGGSSGSSSGPGGRGRGRTPGGSGGTSGGSGNVFSSIWTAYNTRLDRAPITTKACTSLIGFLLGDLLAQKFLGEKGAAVDLARLARMASFGFLIHGPTGHYFYSALDRLIVGTSPIKVASKVAIDQVLWAPIFTAIFFSYLGFAERKPVEDIVAKVKNDTWTGVTTSWKFWPLAHAINFGFIPTTQRLLYINTLQVGYNVILSILGNK